MNIKTVNNKFLPQYNISKFLIGFIALIVITFSGVAYSETKKASKKPVAVVSKEMPALTENYKTELLVRFYDTFKSSLKDNEVIGKLSDKSKELLYNCMAKRMNDTLWNSPAFIQTRSMAAIESQEVIKSNYEYCQLLVAANEALAQSANAQSATQNTKVTNMTFNDLYVDYNNLAGQKVQVKGHFLPYGDLGALSEDATSATTLYTDVSQLSRENRKLLLDQCSSGCKIVIEGTVGNVQYLKGIFVTRLFRVELNSGGYFNLESQ